MSQQRVAAAAFFLMLLATPFGANAGNPCVRGETAFCQGAAAGVPSVRASDWAHWATGSRMRLGGWSGAVPAIEMSETDGMPVYTGRIPLAAASQGARLYPRLGYGAGLPAPDPGAAMYASYPLSESFSLDLTAGKGRVGLRAAAPDAGYAPGAGSGAHTGQGFDRAAWSVALNASRQMGAFGIGGRIGYVDVRDQPDALFDAGGGMLAWGGERPSGLRKSFLGIDASYDISRNWQLHGGAIYRRDEGRIGSSPLFGFGALPMTERDEKEWGVGVRYYGWRNFKLNVEFLKSSGRDQFGNESLLFTGRFDF